MKIAIDLNDVVRDFSNNFIKYYCEGYNHEFDLEELEFFTNDLSIVFPFKTQRAYESFVYNDYAFELFGKCPTCTNNLNVALKEWCTKTIKELDSEESIEVMFVSSMEYGLSIGYTYYFISKIGCEVREVYLPEDSLTIWDKCDVLITANPRLLENKPEGKTSIKISMDYNEETEADYKFRTLEDFITDKNNTEKLLTNNG